MARSESARSEGAKNSRKGSFYSFRNVGETPPFRSTKRISRSAERDKGAALDLQTFEKV